MATHATLMTGTCRASAVSRCSKPAQANAFRAARPVPHRWRPMRPLRAAEAEAEEQTETGSNSGNGKVMLMAESLVERAKEVAATGVVDEDFKAVFVSELESELAALSERAHQAEAQAAALEETLKGTKDQFLRLNADFDNFRKRTAAERDQLKSSVKGDTIMELVPLIDNFELAKTQLKLESEGEKRVDAAYQGLYKQMVETFRKMGLEAVPGVGSPFDPEVHEAIMREPNDDVPDGTVLEEFRKGFRLGETLLRPAMVKVSFSDQPAATTSESSEGESSE